MANFMINGICHDKPDGQGLPVRTAMYVEQYELQPGMFRVTCIRCGAHWDSTHPRSLALSDATIEEIRRNYRKGTKR
jgi:hypothetical protein